MIPASDVLTADACNLLDKVLFLRRTRLARRFVIRRGENLQLLLRARALMGVLLSQSVGVVTFELSYERRACSRNANKDKFLKID